MEWVITNGSLPLLLDPESVVSIKFQFSPKVNNEIFVLFLPLKTDKYNRT